MPSNRESVQKSHTLYVSGDINIPPGTRATEIINGILLARVKKAGMYGIDRLGFSGIRTARDLQDPGYRWVFDGYPECEIRTAIEDITEYGRTMEGVEAPNMLIGALRIAVHRYDDKGNRVLALTGAIYIHHRTVLVSLGTYESDVKMVKSWSTYDGYHLALAMPGTADIWALIELALKESGSESEGDAKQS